MGGNQSWFACDATYPEPDVPSSSAPHQGSGHPILAVIMFLSTLIGLLLLTTIVHCGIVACRSCRSRHRRRRHRRRHAQQQHLDAGGSMEAGAAGDNRSASPAAAALGIAGETKDSAAVVNEDDGDNGTLSSSSSSSTSTSSDTSLDSTTARIAAQVASRRRSRFIDLAGLGGLDAARSSPTPSLRQQQQQQQRAAVFSAAASGFLKPPAPPMTPAIAAATAYDNPAFDSHHDHS